APILPPAGPVDLSDLRRALSEVRNSKAHGTDHAKEQAAILGRALDGEPLADIGHRHHERVRLCGLLGTWLPAGTPWESVLEVVRPCLAATPRSDGESLEAAIEKTRRLYEDAMRSRIAREAKRAEENARIAEVAAKIAGKKTAAVANELGDKWIDLL